MNFGSKTPSGKPKSNLRLSIRTILITVVLAQMLVIAFFTTLISFRNSAKSSGALVSNSIHEMHSRIQMQINSYFEPPVEINNFNERLIRNNLIDASTQDVLLKQFSIQIRARNSVNSIYYGNVSGGLANAGIDKAKKRYYVIYTDKYKSGKFYKYATNDDYEKTLLISQLPDFDARTRPWYINAVNETGVVWSDVYIIATGNDLGITASKAVRDKNDRLLGVVGVDLFLSDISTFLSNLNLGTGGQSFILGKSGQLIASSNHDKLFNIDETKHIQTRIKGIDSKSELVRKVSMELAAKYSDFQKITQDSDFNVDVDGTTYLVNIKPFSAIPTHQWYIITAIPKITFMSQVYANNRISIYLIFVSLFLSIILAVLLARIISSPILNLDKRVRAISKGEWQSEPLPSHIKEIDGLTREIYKMKSTIQSSIETLNDEITERIKTESFLQDIIDKNPISIQIVDKDGCTVKSNAANAKLFGMAPPPDFSVFTDPQIQAQGQTELLEKAKNGEVVYLPDMYYNIHNFHPSLPDKPIWVKVVIFPIKGRDGKPESFVLMHEDITNRKSIEEALIAAKESAEENDRLKSSFLANMSHELRTPLSGILGFSELLKEQLKDDTSRDMANMINQSGNRLLNTLNLILDLSQIEANMQKIQCSTFDLNKLLGNIIRLFKPVAAKKGLELSFNQDHPKLYVNSDSNMFEHIINELVSNAIKYTDKGSVSVSAGISENEHESRFTITISDTGIGIPKENQESIFDAFRQVSEGWNRSFEGTGLGLTICKKYVNLLGGNINLESNFGNGSRFILSFPIELLQTEMQDVTQQDSKSEVSEPEHNVNIASLPKILLVDDDNMCHILVTKMLRDVAEIVYTATGEESLVLMKDNVYSAVLLDINLKVGLSGLDVLKEIKNWDNYKNIPIIAITAYAMLDDREKLLSNGFTDYISKPFTSSDLINIVEKWIIRN